MRRSVRAIVAVCLFAIVASALTVPTAAAPSRVLLSAVASGYTRPVLVTYAPGSPGIVFVVEQTGKIKRASYQGGAWKKLGTFLDLRRKVSNGGERGLLGLAFHPRYQQNGRFYVNYTRAGRGDKQGDSVIAEYRRKSAAKANPSSRRVLMTVDQPASNHNGGHLAFGPDGLLYIGLGDGGGGGDPYRSGQDLGTGLGKLLRIDPLDPDGAGSRRYGVPRSNPFVGKRGLDDIWARGLRNPWRFSFDRQNGDLWIGDVGQAAREEIDRSKSNTRGRDAGKGRNYGWSRCEGSRRYPNANGRCTFGTRPVHDYPHGPGRCSVTGGYVHRGPNDRAWRGLYVAGDYCGRLFVLNADGKVKLSRVTRRQISSFGEDAAGRIFATDLGSGRIYQVRFGGPRP